MILTKQVAYEKKKRCRRQSRIKKLPNSDELMKTNEKIKYKYCNSCMLEQNSAAIYQAVLRIMVGCSDNKENVELAGNHLSA